jgi:hypothetical protein
MEKNQIIDLFLMWVKRHPINLYGLDLDIYKVDGDLEFWVDNPKNLSVNYESVYNILFNEYQLFRDFFNLDAESTNVIINDLSNYYKSLGRGNKFHLNSTDEKTINELLKRITKLDFGKKDPKLICDIVCISIEFYCDGEQIDVNLELEIKSFKRLGENRPLGDLLGYFRNFMYDDYRNYDDVCFELMYPILNVIERNPLLFDNGYHYFNCNIKPKFYIRGKDIELY